MKMLKQIFILALLLLLGGFGDELVVHAQNYDSSGFISIDCGIPRNTNYKEPSTELNYISDEDFIATGTVRSIASEFKTSILEQLKTLRSFPEGTRNCFKINATANVRYLIRASFYYGNYDGKDTFPEFDLHIGGNFWDTVRFPNGMYTEKEIIHILRQSHVLVCLVNKGSGTPFISTLELRPISEQVYYYNNSLSFESLALLYRMDIGSTKKFSYRYPYDISDRTWTPSYFSESWIQINMDPPLNNTSRLISMVPSVVMSTATSTRLESHPLFLYWSASDKGHKFYFYMFFMELQQLKDNESRSMTITLNGEDVYSLAPRYLKTDVFFNLYGSSGSRSYNLTLNKNENSTLLPILNAFELFYVLDVSQSETEESDVDGMNNIKSSYGVSNRNWEGDPCVPTAYLWTGLNCSYDGVDHPRIIYLNLSSSGLTGEISKHIEKLSAVETLDLSNNSLSGSVPDFLSNLPNLKILNLEGNKLSGSIPIGLIEKANKGVLTLRIPIVKKNKNINVGILIAALVGGVVLLSLIATPIVVVLKKKKKQDFKPQKEAFESNKRQYTYAEVKKMTNDFTKVLGKGGFGEVYHGFIDENTQVAVKMLSSSSGQGYQQFEAEVKLLMKVYHGNLTSLVGYCYEEPNMALIYEYMENGDLASHLSGASSNKSVLSWEGRIQIAIDAAQGLEYLHNGCKPPIIHRDIKTANILLNEKFQAKIADFGLSKSFAADNCSHVSVSIVGTHGYLDPKYRETGWLNEKSDIYSFGTVLLEIITSRPPLITIRNNPIEKIHIRQWVSSIISRGVITNIVDSRLQGDFDTNSVWKAIEVGMACASEAPTTRPNMSQVVNELKECLALEIARKNNHSSVTDSNTMDSEVFLPPSVTSEFRPSAR